MNKFTWKIEDVFETDSMGYWKQIGLPSGTYYDDEWYKFLVQNYYSIIPELYGEREIIIKDRDYRQGLNMSDSEFREFLITKIKRRWYGLFLNNLEWYRKLYDTLQLEYNPLYNVDGTEERSYTKTNTGTQENTTTQSGVVTTTDSFDGSEKRENTRTGSIDDDVSYKGQENNDKTYLGSEIVNNGGHSTEQLTTFDNANFLDNTNHVEDLTTTKGFNGRQDTDSKYFVNRTDERDTTYNNLKDTEITSFTDRENVSETNYDDLTNESTRTDDLSEEYVESITRYGNIGVTKSTELVESELNLRKKWNFLKIVCKDMVESISYSVY